MLSFGLSVAFIGISMVFSALLLLMLVIKGQGMIIAWCTQRKNEKQTMKMLEPMVALNTEENNLDDQPEDEELVAILTAAVLAATGKQVLVQQIRRIDTNSSWAQSAKLAQLQSRV